MKTTNTPNTRKQHTYRAVLFASIASLMFGTATVQADDVEIYLTPPPSPVSPNVLFILDESGSMSSTTHSPTGEHSTRNADLRSSLTAILNDPDNGNINAGIMAYTTHNGNNGPLSLRAISDFLRIEDNRASMVTGVDSLRAWSYTPSVKALEAGVEWFKNEFTDSPYNFSISHLRTTPQTYASPIGNDPVDNWCRPNHMVFLTDGLPNSNRASTPGDPGHNWTHANGDYILHYGVTEYPAPGTTTPDVHCEADPFFAGGLCSGEIVEWASNSDLKTADGWTDIQNIVTHTIGFGITGGSNAEGYLQNLANLGKGNYYPAANATDLKAAFDQILSDATTSIPYTYSSPTIPYNPDNAAISDDFLYIPMFNPLAKVFWKGNLKKYRIGTDNNGDVFIKDFNNANVVNSDFLFNGNTQDYWSDTANTGDTFLGGSASNMSSTVNRRLYTWLPDSDINLTAAVAATDPSGNPVTISPNRVHTDNVVITSGLLGTGTAASRADILDWANWADEVIPSGETYANNDDFPIVSATAGASTNPDGVREYMGASLHTKPEVARYRPILEFTPYLAVDALENTITFSQAPIWNTGDRVVYSNGSGTSLPIAGGGTLTDGGEYYVVNTGGTAIKLAQSKADALASTPVVIDLDDVAVGVTSIQTLATRDAIDIILVATSEGVLHAFNGGTDTVDTPVGDGGGELWSFMPRHFLDRIKNLKDNAAAGTPDYGLDGPITVFESGAEKYVAITMRRGGRNIYVLNITDLSAPKFAWEIIGGTTTGFERLGQTWSEPRFVSMEINGAAARDVLVFGGGYDNTTQDHNASGVIPASRANDTMGNAIYVVDAVTGARLAYFTADTTTDTSATENRLQVSGMENGIIGLLPVDINNNGITDRIYATGVGGRVFRIDIPDSGFSSTIIKGGVIADINADPGNTGFQRFFNDPEVAYYSRGGNTFLAILIGSGYRPSPLDNTTTDRFYMIKDTDVFNVPASYTTLTEADLYDATSNEIQAGTTAEQGAAETALSAKNGWYIDLLAGNIKQKSFSKAGVFNSVILFSTYQGERDVSADVCLATTSEGLSNFYAISLLDASAAVDIDESGSITTSDRSLSLSVPGLPPSPVVLFPGDGTGGSISLDGRKATVIVGLQSVFRFPDRFFPVNWEEIIPTAQ